MNKWIDHKYGTGATIDFGIGGKITVTYDMCQPKEIATEKYIISINGIKVKNRFKNFEDAKRGAIQFLKEKLIETEKNIIRYVELGYNDG